MGSPRHLAWPLAVVAGAVAVVAAALPQSTLAAFKGETLNAANTWQAKPDWTPPSITGSIIVLASGQVPGTVGPGQSYHVYANVADGGTPASGAGTVTADVSTVTTGLTAVALSGGSYYVGSTSYGWRSGPLTSDAGLTEGSKQYTQTAFDVAGNGPTQSNFAVTVDATPPSAVDVQTFGDADGLAEQGEVVVFTFSEAMAPTSVLSGWNGAATPVTLRLNRAGGVATMTVLSGATQLNLGSVVIGNHLNNNSTADFTGSTMALSGADVTIALGTHTGAALSGGQPTTMSWTPLPPLTDAVGNGLSSTAAVPESGTADKDF